MTLCGSCKNLCFGGTYRLHYQGEKNQRARKFKSTLVLTRTTRRHIPEIDIHYSLHRVDLKAYIALTGCAL
jgi:hypothetical protein